MYSVYLPFARITCYLSIALFEGWFVDPSRRATLRACGPWRYYDRFLGKRVSETMG